jgi:hypothetical protein
VPPQRHVLRDGTLPQTPALLWYARFPDSKRPVMSVACGEWAMAIRHDHGTERGDSEALLPMVWLGAGMLAIVAFTYWLNAF